MTPSEILWCMAAQGYHLNNPDKCCKDWVDSYDSTPPQPAHFESITAVCEWLAENYTGGDPCAG